MNEILGWFVLCIMWVAVVVCAVILWRVTKVLWNQHKERKP